MVHRYPTRFQLKKAQNAPLQVASLQSAPQQEDVGEHVSYMLDRVNACTSYLAKVIETIKLFEYMYEHPILFETRPYTKYVMWDKMLELDRNIFEALRKLPVTLYDPLVESTQKNSIRLHEVMNRIREKYY